MESLSSALLPVLNGLKVALGLGFVVFIHELGHFLLAKWNGVKVEKFSIGFGPTIFGFHRGETEYVIAAIPLGGFVKMLGENPEQEDAPSADPRAFHNKPVGGRMAIICAGVIMNIIFGVFCNAFLFTQPRLELASRVGVVNPGSPAYEAGLRPGDDIVAIDGQSGVGFSDLMRKVILSGEGQVLDFTVKREGHAEPISFKIKPKREGDHDRPLIGVQPGFDLDIAFFNPPAGMADPPTYPEQDEKLRPTTGDFIKAVAIEGESPKPVANFDELQDLMEKYPDKTFTLTVDRRPIEPDSKEKSSEFTLKLPPNRFVDFGLRLNFSPIVMIQKDSVAEKAGFQVGDLIVQVDGKEDIDPMRLPYELHEKQGKPVTFVVERSGGGKEPRKVTLTATPGGTPPWVDPYSINSALDVPGLGLCYNVTPRVHSVVPDSPAAKAGLKPGDMIYGMSVPPPFPKGELKKSESAPQEFKFESSTGWVRAFLYLQTLKPRPVKLNVNNAPKEVEIEPVVVADWFNPSRGLFYQNLTRTAPPRDLVGAIQGGLTKTYSDILDIYTMLRGLFQQRIGASNLGGPISIAQIAYKAAGQGWTDLLGFLGAMSINLAVLNFLPIPPLDGGQMVFLLVEKIRGRPLPESILVGAIYVGLPLVLLVMVFATYQDVFRLVKNIISP